MLVSHGRMNVRSTGHVAPGRWRNEQRAEAQEELFTYVPAKLRQWWTSVEHESVGTEPRP